MYICFTSWISLVLRHGYHQERLSVNCVFLLNVRDILSFTSYTVLTQSLNHGLTAWNCCLKMHYADMCRFWPQYMPLKVFLAYGVRPLLWNHQVNGDLYLQWEVTFSISPVSTFWHPWILLKQTVSYPPAAAAASLHTNPMRPRFNRSIIHSRWGFGAPYL